MASTTFVNGTVVIPTWLNDVNTVVYTALGSGGVVPATAAQVRTNIGIGLGPNGTDNYGIGAFALSSVTTGFGCTALGFHALKSLTSPGYCTAVGSYALENADQPSN